MIGAGSELWRGNLPGGPAELELPSDFRVRPRGLAVFGNPGIAGSRGVQRCQWHASNPNSSISHFCAPFNRVSRYREPGKVNLNTISDTWLKGNVYAASTATLPAPYYFQHQADIFQGMMNDFPGYQHIWDNLLGGLQVQRSARRGQGLGFCPPLLLVGSSDRRRRRAARATTASARPTTNGRRAGPAGSRTPTDIPRCFGQQRQRRLDSAQQSVASRPANADRRRSQRAAAESPVQFHRTRLSRHQICRSRAICRGSAGHWAESRALGTRRCPRSSPTRSARSAPASACRCRRCCIGGRPCRCSAAVRSVAAAARP